MKILRSSFVKHIFFSQKNIFTPKTSCYSHTIHSRWGCVFFTQNVPGTCRAPGLLKHKKLRAARYPLVRQWLNPGWFARHLKAMCFPTRKKRGDTTVYNWRKNMKKPYCKWWYCTCRPHWYLCIFVVCIDAVCIDACIPGGDHQMSCFVVCYFHNYWDFDNRPIGRLAA